MRLPGWVVGYVRAGSLLGMFFGLFSILLMGAGAPQHPIYWPTMWTSVGLTLFTLGVFIASIAPMGETVTHTPVAAGAHAAAVSAGDDERYTGPASVVDTETRVSTTPGNDLVDSAPTQRRAMAASAMERSANVGPATSVGGARTNNAANNGANGANANNNGARRPVRPRP